MITAERRVAILLPAKEGFSPGRAGAIALIVRDLAAATPPGWQTLVLGPDVGAPPFPAIAFEGVRPSLLDKLRGAAAAYGAAAARALRRAAPALIEVHNRPDLALRLARRLPGTPVTLVLHNDPRGMRHAKTAADRRTLLHSLGAICCVSGYILERLTGDLGATPPGEGRGRGIVMHNGLPLAALPTPALERENLILFVGRLAADKGADTFVRGCALALPDLPGWQAAIIGADRFRADSPETPFTRALRPEAEAAGIALRGFLDNTATLAAIARTAIVVVPSRWNDPFPRVAQEAMACGAALIATRRGGLPESAGDAALYVDHEDPADLAAALRRVATDATLRADLAASGLQRARRYDMPETIARWTTLRQSLLPA